VEEAWGVTEWHGVRAGRMKLPRADRHGVRGGLPYSASSVSFDHQILPVPPAWATGDSSIAPLHPRGSEP